MSSPPLAALTIKPPAAEPFDPLAQAGKAMSLKAMMTGQQEANLQLEEKKRMLAENKAVRDAIAAANGDIKAALPKIAQVAPEKAAAFKKQIDEWDTADLTKKKAMIDLNGKKLERMGQIAGSITDQSSYTAALDQAMKEGVIDQGTYHQLSDQPFDPTVVKQFQTQALTAKEQLENHFKELEAKDKSAKQTADIEHQKATEVPEKERSFQADYKRMLAATGQKANAKLEYDFKKKWEKTQAELTRAGRASVLAPETAPTDTLAKNPESQSILAQTGLNLPAFMALTGSASQLPRDQASRNKAFSEAQKWANENGVDISTIGSQYKAANDTLQQNIQRMNNTKIMEDELQGTIDNLKGVAKDADLGKLRFPNVAKIWAGQEVNDETAQQYALHLGQLRNELSAYYAATQGRSGAGVTVQDQREAEQVIKNGISSGSLDGLRKAVENSTDKMGKVMSRSVDSSRKQVWNLFGVGEKFKGSAPAAGGGKIEVTAPNGKTYTFGDQASADNFKAAAGIK